MGEAISLFYHHEKFETNKIKRVYTSISSLNCSPHDRTSILFSFVVGNTTVYSIPQNEKDSGLLPSGKIFLLGAKSFLNITPLIMADYFEKYTSEVNFAPGRVRKRR